MHLCITNDQQRRLRVNHIWMYNMYNVFAYEQTVPKLQIEIRIVMLQQAMISICHLARA